MEGDITTEYTVWCGLCSNWHQEANSKNKAEAIQFFRRVYGWKKSKERGWICPVCVERKISPHYLPQAPESSAQA